MLPEVVYSTPRIMLIEVVFTAPLGPRSPTISLRFTSNETPFTATVDPYCLRKLRTESTFGVTLQFDTYFRFETNCHLGRSNMRENNMRLISDFLFLILFFMLIGVWLVMWIGFHLVGGVIHLLLIIAVISLILHLFRRRTA
jgi:hypothetical protein